MLPPFQLQQAIESTIQEEWGRILAALVKATGDLQLAEDVLQDAVEKALMHWPQHGLPKSPAAWLIQTARRKAIDHFRRGDHFNRLQPELSYLLDLENSIKGHEDEEVIVDKRLELIFTCCHPALEEKTRIALTLRTLGGLTTEEIARAFLNKPKAMAQRLVRAKKKIALAGIPYQVPDAELLPERLPGVLSVIYLIFNEGYSASFGKMVTRDNLSDEAIRLARICLQLMPEETEVAGLLSLMLLHDSRRFARQDKAGEMIALEHQNRNIWNRSKIGEGVNLLKRSLRRQKLGPYQLQAAISGVHAEAESWASTDWPQIAALYALLYRMQPTPVVRINQAIAVSHAQSAEAALEMLTQVEQESGISHYQPFYAAMADVLVRAGKNSEAAESIEQAIALSSNEAEKRFLSRKLEKLRSVHTDSTVTVDTQTLLINAQDV